MKVLILSVFFWICVLAQKESCKSGYHFWRPYNGTLPRDAFIAGTDEDGKKIAVAKVIAPQLFSSYGVMVIPAQLKENSHDVVATMNSTTYTFTFFIEVLCTEYPERLVWKQVRRATEEIYQKCCLLNGGMITSLNFQNIDFPISIGKVVVNGETLIGRLIGDSVHVMDGVNPRSYDKNYQVLTYDCDEDRVEPKGKQNVHVSLRRN